MQQRVYQSMTLTSCISVLSPWRVDWNSALWMMPLISGNVVWEPESTPKADILNITQAYRLLVRILCRYFNAFMQTFQCSCEKASFSYFTRWSETCWYPDLRNSFLVNLVQKFSKSVNICKSYCKKFTGTFFMDTVYITANAHASNPCDSLVTSLTFLTTATSCHVCGKMWTETRLNAVLMQPTPTLQTPFT